MERAKEPENRICHSPWCPLARLVPHDLENPVSSPALRPMTMPTLDEGAQRSLFCHEMAFGSCMNAVSVPPRSYFCFGKIEKPPEIGFFPLQLSVTGSLLIAKSCHFYIFDGETFGSMRRPLDECMIVRL